MRTPDTFAIAELVPHAGGMSLLSRALEGGDEYFVAEVDVRRDGLFFDGTGVGAWTGIEYMAQTIAAWAGWLARNQGRTPQVGFLLGCRRYDCQVDHFLPGQTLVVTIERQYQAENGLGQFDCTIKDGEQLLAAATVSVFKPDNATEFVNVGK